MTRPYRIGVFDDHLILRRGIVENLSEDDDFVVVAEGGSADDAVDAAKRLTPDLCLLDINMPGGGIEAARRIMQTAPGVLTLVFSYRDDPETKAAALEAGACGYVLKGFAGGDDLNDAVRKAVISSRVKH